MKKILLLCAFFTVFALSAKDLKVLAIGNSFSICVIKNLPQMVASVPGNRIVFTSCYIGGCSLQRHWQEWQRAEKDSNHRPYGISVIDSSDLKTKRSRNNINSLLKNNKYDIITIQQNSANSWKENSYQPYARYLIAQVRKYQPQAEIVIQQTWSYRSDATRLRRWKMSNSAMYEKLEAAYAKLAGENGFRIIPTGFAVQIFRDRSPVKYKTPDRKKLAELKNPKPHAFEGDVVGFFRWQKNRKSKKFYLGSDDSHLNAHGEYLQAAVWFNFLFDQPATAVKYVPKDMKPEFAKFLLQCAQDAVASYKQPGK